VNPGANDQEIQQMLDSESGPIFTQQILASGQPETKKTLQEIKDRYQELLKLERSIKELHQLFLDMAALVQAQREDIDRIDDNVKQARQYTAEGYREMKKAVVYQKRARKVIISLFESGMMINYIHFKLLY
jgi:t-SNARE complex subunit (syntaxin)